MRPSIILTLCFLGVVSANSLHKRSFFDDFQNKTQEGFKALEGFGHDFNEKLQEAFKNLLNGLQNNSTHAVQKRATNPLELINDLSQGNPAKFAQDLLKVLADMALQQGRRKRDLFGDLQKFADFGRQKAEETFNKFQNGDILGNLQKLAEEGRKQAEEAIKNFQNGDVLGNLQKFAEEGRKNAEEALKNLQNGDIFGQLQKFADAGRKQAEEAMKNMKELIEGFQKNEEDTTEVSVSKRDLFSHIERFNERFQQQAEKIFSNFRDAFENMFNNGASKKPVEIEEDTTEVSVEKRDIFDQLGLFNQRFQDGFKQAFDNMFHHGPKPGHKRPPPPPRNPEHEEDSTEVSVEKRDIFEQLGKINEKIQDSFKQAFDNIFKPANKRPAQPKPVEEEIDEIATPSTL